ncbi:hypothetical protein HCJ76_42600 [Streptomyces sp. MC1]|uniref:hypothetical protein n=1 Tax=Streptomyces sp. MC1 TaxID=295105 RepID=UPI0018CBDE4A|nr:hypothetical protein [Streptomyces sp. MC1]MBG7704607.1 hypothetical protein [Streptomyces sp. MC1]
MTVQLLVVLMLVLGMCILFSALAGLIGFGIARLVRAPVDKAIGWGSIVALSVMTLCIAVLAIVVPLVR